MDRDKLIDQLDSIYEKLCRNGLDDKAEEILTANNASEDDSDPDEGFMSTMSDRDLRNAIREMEAAYSSTSSDTAEGIIHAINGGLLDASSDYCDGFMDACRMLAEEYGLSLSGIDD